ncbi:lactate dehydrogenase [Paracoccus sp. S-4012]|uniref:class I SAM-dependent DNA methyltransferase n=1 Tax=Paracoccus sp. S-4012 TaxID=2665648 RepID=UPI0012B10294|nr:DNA methyltransferase [Paracoccus sp. S-4012]MRX51333.1 lactate dehydrogenase [Paracoccus sp. S-4012]
MNAVEIEEAVSTLAEASFDPVEFPFAFLQAFGNKETTLRRLRKGESNRSDVGGVLQTGNIHIKVAAPGEVPATLAALRASPATTKSKARFIVASDGDTLEAEDLTTGETIATGFREFPDHFGVFLPLAGISTVSQIRESTFDIRATSRLNRLYVELLRENPDWGSDARRVEMNHFMARLIFCFFAEDTDIFHGTRRFTSTVEQMSDAGNAHHVIGEIFRAMNTPIANRATSGLRPWADAFPYVNGGLFSGPLEVPRLSRIARSYLLHVGSLDWTKINPDIFGSMIQAVADDEERGALGMHYTSVPNILKVLNPLFLDDLNAKLAEAGDNPRRLLNLRNRMARIRVFDPACGSGNFLVIAYKEMRAIEAEINRRRGEADRATAIPLTNFRGIELRDFPAEIARLALIIAEYQCDVLHRGQKEALAEFLPLDSQNWITCGNALRLDWLSICPPTGTAVKVASDDLFGTPLDHSEIDFENEGGETYICGNPPYLGFTWQSAEQKADLRSLFSGRTRSWRSLDYVCGWFIKAVDYSRESPASTAFVATNSICQGQIVPILWPLILESGNEISFAYTSFKWANLANYNAGVTVVIVGISLTARPVRRLFSVAGDGSTLTQEVPNINPYLVPSKNVIVAGRSTPLGPQSEMVWGNKPTDGGHLFMTHDPRAAIILEYPNASPFIKRFLGAQEFIRGQQRYCLWIEDDRREEAEAIPEIARRLNEVARVRSESTAVETRPAAAFPHRFRQIQSTAKTSSIVVARVSSESREYLPVGLEDSETIIGDRNFALYDSPLWNLALIASRLHWVWIGTVCVRMRTDFSYSNTLGWNTFPVPTLTAQNRADLTRTAENILLAREAHYPATIADLYDPERMPDHLRAAHESNDEVLERIYIGRRFRNDTERLEHLFALYTKMVATPCPKRKQA